MLNWFYRLTLVQQVGVVLVASYLMWAVNVPVVAPAVDSVLVQVGLRDEAQVVAQKTSDAVRSVAQQIASQGSPQPERFRR